MQNEEYYLPLKDRITGELLWQLRYGGKQGQDFVEGFYTVGRESAVRAKEWQEWLDVSIGRRFWWLTKKEDGKMREAQRPLSGPLFLHFNSAANAVWFKVTWL
jgi:hypothetical protein